MLNYAYTYRDIIYCCERRHMSYYTYYYYNIVTVVIVFLCFVMMFNGLLVYGDSDTSDFTKESIAASSIGSAGSDARSRTLETKLMATLEVLKNKEETVRIQAESLALAEARIAELSARSQPCGRHHRADQTDPLHSTRSSADGCCVETSDGTAQTQEVDSKMVITLQDNLSVIEELYRECFYETAKQEELIDMLRKSYLDMRLMERQKSARLHRLQGVVDTQQWSLERCQDIALEVDNLKSEISNFLSSSNHDSGMWERSDEPLAAEVSEELQHISRQLHRLREVLTNDCTCGLKDENMRLKEINDSLEIQIGELQQKVLDLESALEDKENIDQHFQKQINMKDLQISSLRQQLAELEEDSKKQKDICTALSLQIQQLQVLLQDRSEELTMAQKQCEEHEATISQLRLEVGKAENASKEQNKQVHDEVTALSAQVCEWRRQLQDSQRRMRALDEQLQRSKDHCRHLEHLYSEKESFACALQEQLQEARARGAALCADVRRALLAVRCGLRRRALLHRDQEKKIKEQDKLIRTLQQRQMLSEVDLTSSEACCSKHFSVQARRSERSRTCGSETASCSKCPPQGIRIRDEHTSASELSSGQSAPTPPRRLRKKPICDDRHCQWPSYREASSQKPLQSDAETRISHDSLPTCPARQNRETCSTEELLERVEHTLEAFVEAQRRWRRAACGHKRQGT